MKTQGAHHVSLTIDDLEAARAFYGGVLGLDEIERPDLGIGGAWYQAGTVQLHLIVAPPGVDTGSPAPNLTPLAHHVAFAIEDAAAIKEELEAAGHELIWLGPAAGQIFLRDPAGSVIELNQSA